MFIKDIIKKKTLAVHFIVKYTIVPMNINKKTILLPLIFILFHKNIYFYCDILPVQPQLAHYHIEEHFLRMHFGGNSCQFTFPDHAMFVVPEGKEIT
jgi:hypothetical protein